MQILSQDLIDYYNSVCCPIPTVTYNFDVTADWVTNGITDQASFESFIQQNDPLATVTSFKLSGNKLEAIVNNIENFIPGSAISTTKIDKLPNTITWIEIINGTPISTFNISNLTNLIGLSVVNCGLSSLSLVDYSKITSIEISNNIFSQNTLDQICTNLLNYNILSDFRSQNQVPLAQPSLSNKTSISALCASNGGSATF